MSVKGFTFGSDPTIQKYDYEALDNKPDIESVESDITSEILARQEADAEFEEAIHTLTETKASIDGTYPSLAVGSLLGAEVEDSVPYLYRPTGGGLSVGDREYDTLVGGTLGWNQLAHDFNYTTMAGVEITQWGNGLNLNGTSTEDQIRINNWNIDVSPNHVCLTYSKNISGNIYLRHHLNAIDTFVHSNGYALIRTKAVQPNSKTAFYLCADTGTVFSDLKIYPQLIDLTTLFGATIADYIYSFEQATAGAGVAWFKKLFPKDYYEYSAPTLKHVEGVSAHEMTGFNAYNPETGKAKLVGGVQYQITGTYTSISYSTGETLTPDSNGKFTPTSNGELTVTGGDASTTCVHLVWDGERDGEYEPYVKHSYPLASTLTLRGIPKLDSANQLYYDGDTYEADGTVTRYWAERAYQTGDATDGSTMITDGAKTVYKLTTPTTETALAYEEAQICDPHGTEQYVTESIVPVGHATKYPENLAEKIFDLPALPTTAGEYKLKVTVTGGKANYTWVSA